MSEADAAGHLRQQVRELELALTAAHSALQECRQQKEMFETAASERLEVILRGEKLLKARMEAIAGLQEESAQLRQQADELAAQLTAATAQRSDLERRALRQANESARGMAELAERERKLTIENLELRNEGLLHSIIRRISRIFS